jgi:hypothetical protein
LIGFDSSNGGSGSGKLDIATLKSSVAANNNYADFQTAIAAL